MKIVREGSRTSAYRSGYLRSAVWFARRDRWFREELTRSDGLSCAGCGQGLGQREAELHHLDYRGVGHGRGRWFAHESHDDLVGMHPLCHELLHRLIDRDRALARLRRNRAASRHALVRLRTRLASVTEGGEG